MSGFDAQAAQARIAGLFPDRLGIIIVEAKAELVVGRLAVAADLCTTGDILHGGAIMAFADTLGALGTVVNLPERARTVTVESSTKFIAAARLGTVITGESRPLHRGRTTMVWTTTIHSQEGRLCAVVTQTQLVLPEA